ncbi:MAG: hypothetical protein L0Z68_09535 [Gammaproteobacteria bacterium]|nr:hypothetical protein [Gammaproteobacteria bacterium]
MTTRSALEKFAAPIVLADVIQKIEQKAEMGLAIALPILPLLALSVDEKTFL